MNQNRSNFTGKLGFVLAAAGSAVGLGNIWRFPYLAAKYGGGIFLFVYLILALTLGFALLTAEIALGRKTGLSAVGAFSSLSKKYAFIGYLESIVPMIILPYYCVIGGWVTKYFVQYLTGGASQAATDGFFKSFTSDFSQPLVWFTVFFGITAIVVLLGVEKGIEKVSKLMMPLLVLLSVVIAGYCVFLPGAKQGLMYYFLPDFSKFSVMTVLGAMGQLFYSMSIAMGIMITYGSYMKKEVNIESAVHQIEIFDTGIAFLAGMMVIPPVFAFNASQQNTTIDAGPGLMFETLPKVFESMPGGKYLGVFFFLLVFFAALTSSISIMEAVVSVLRDKFGISRIVSCIISFVIVIALGVPSSLGNGLWKEIKVLGMSFLDFFDFISNSVIMPIVAILTCIFIGYVIKPEIVTQEVELSGKFKNKTLFVLIIKYFAPVCIFLILVSSVLSAFNIITI
ncbi:MAG: sodium-dependent transporter [Clostridia bacterium]|nr:sodium-dependent transporter [Clostridia bacterium]